MNRSDRLALPVVLLAAGKGERLMPLTESCPKAMVQVGGMPLAERALNELRAAGAGRVVVIGGHGVESLVQLGAEVRINPRYETTDNVYSLYLARDVVGRGCFIVNSDVLFGAEIARRLVAQRGTVLLCDDSHPPGPEAMKIAAEGDMLNALSKKLPTRSAIGEYIGLARIDPAHGPELRGTLERFVASRRVHVYYEDALADIAQRVPVQVCSVGSLAWIEIDDHDDLKRAQEIVVPRLESDVPAR